MIDRLIGACRAYHDALDMAFAMLIITTGDHPQRMPQFFPSESGMWPAAVEGKRIVDEIEAARKR